MSDSLNNDKPLEPSDDVEMSGDLVRKLTVLNIQETPRAKKLQQHHAFYQCSQHDHLNRDWNGGYRDPGVGYLHERLRPQGFVPVQSIPSASKKPDTAYPLSKQITNKFSEMLLGSNKRPSIYVPADLKTQRYLEACFSESCMWDVLLEARDVAGSCGSCVIVPGVMDGVPFAEVLLPYDVHVTKWKPNALWEPLEIVEQRLVERLVEDDEGKLVSKKYWRTRLWNETHTILYDDVPEDHEGRIPFRKENKIEHHGGRCIAIWYQNTRCAKSPDGSPDCDGTWPLLDQIDRLSSQVAKAARANADPTLHIKDEERARRKPTVIHKGSGGVITTSTAGDAKYLEIEGTSVKVGMDLIKSLRTEVLQTVGCVIVDPDTSAAYKSGEALQLLWRTMESRANRLRVTLSRVMREVARIYLSMGRTLGVANLEDENPGEGILLPPVIHRPDMAEDPEELEVNDAITETQEIGTGSHVEFKWAGYWAPTAMQISDMANAMATSKASETLSEETRVGEMARFIGVDPVEELLRVLKDKKLREEKEEELFEKEYERAMEERAVDGANAKSAATKPTKNNHPTSKPSENKQLK